ncbi:MAG: adenylate/guanylate cyclase domain-containing protein [Armatimonadetes bacterium]|nr:adenylate/guanylate cyclase domain-containing protein [Armatimonadota bacterium]
MRRQRVRAILGSPPAIALLVVVLLLVLAPALSFWEVRVYDLLFRLNAPTGLDSHVEVIDIGADASAYDQARPDLRVCPKPPEGCEVPRSAYAELVRDLHRWGAKVVAFDIWFSRPCDVEDPKLAAAFREAGNVIVAATAKVIPDAVSLQPPVAALAKALQRPGAKSAEPEPGEVPWGVGSPVVSRPNQDVRSVPLVLPDQDSGCEYSALSLLAFQRFSGIDPSDRHVDEGRSLTTGGHRIPLVSGERIHLLPPMGGGGSAAAADSGDGITVVSGNNLSRHPRLTSWNAMLVNWAGPGGAIQPLQLLDVLAMQDTQGKQRFGGKAVIVGRRNWDEQWTGVGRMAGPDIQANALHTMLSGRFISPLPYWLRIPLPFLLALTTAWLVRRAKVVRSIFAVVLLMLIVVVVGRELLGRSLIWAYVLTMQSSIVLAWAITSSAQSQKVAGVLRRFIPAFMEVREAGVGAVDEIQTREASVLYSDIRNYTTISEKLEAEQILRLLSAYRASVEDVIRHHGGAIVITPGDAVLAVFWRDHRGANHPTSAVRAGREVLAKVPELARPWQELGVELQVGVGVNAGPIAMGFVGKENLEATVIGDAVNVSQRLESLTKELGYSLILSESVRSQLPDDIETVFVDEVKVKGRELPIRVYGVVDGRGAGKTHDE